MAITAALAGNPNCGKTTLFNALTGSTQYVGNWPGVTVEKKEGYVKHGEEQVLLVDLPGIYSLSPYTMEEVVARDYVVGERPAVLINILDGTNIERNLYLTLQLLELGTPVVLALNMIDEVRARGDRIDVPGLSHALGVPVVPVCAKRGENLDELVRQAVCEAKERPERLPVRYDARTERALREVEARLEASALPAGVPSRYFAAKLLEGDAPTAARLGLHAEQRAAVERAAAAYEREAAHGDRETLLADARYQAITALCTRFVQKKRGFGKPTLSDRIDRIATSRVLALPVFLLLMLCMFLLVFGPAGETMKHALEWLTGEVAAPAASAALAYAGAPDWMTGLLVDGVIGGVGGVLTFLPQIMLLFLFLSLMEDSGYMARAAFIMDRLLRRLGLSGKSFIPMLMGFGCTTPAVMAARALENEKERKLTIMLTPFMSCGARLPVYALFAGVFFAENQGLVVFGMYLLGMAVAVFSGLALKKTVFRGESAPFVMELPQYRLPGLRSVLLHMWDKCRGFLVKAGTVIFSMSVALWFCQHFTPALRWTENSAESLFGLLGAAISPLFAPLGFGFWQAAVALLAGLVAKEAVVSSICMLYGVSAGSAALGAAIAGAFTPAAALSFMTFSLLYMPCISAFVTIRKEMGSLRWALAVALWQTAAAYLFSFLVHRAALLFLG